MKTQRVHRRIMKYLSMVDSATTGEILAHVNNTLRHGSTMSAISNVLGKCPEFVCKETTGGRYRLKVWKLSENERT